MALPLPSPQRDFAPVTHDTNRIGEVITELNAHAGGNGHAGIYQPSALVQYLETSNGGSGSTIQTIPNIIMTTLDVAGAWSNAGGGFNPTTDIYQLPAGGIYVCQALVRLADSIGSSFNVGLGVHTSNIDGYWFQWNKYVTGGGGRCSFDYTRVASFGINDQLRLYMFQESGGNLAITAINLSIWRIG